MTDLDVTTLLLSLKTAGAATALASLFGLAAAWAMAGRDFRGKSLVDALFLAPLVLPPTVIGFALLVVFGAGSPVGGLVDRAFGSGLLFTWPAAVIAASVVAFPLMYRTARGAFEQVDPALSAAARTLGAGEWRVFLRVLLPAARPGVVAGVVLAFARALGEFGATLMVAGNLPGRTRTIPLAIYADVESGDLRHAAMWTFVVVGLTLGLALLANLSGRRRPARVAPTDRDGQSERPVTFAVSPAEVAAISREKPLAHKSLEVRIAKRFGDFSLDVAFSAPRSVAVLGASGAGKSLVLKCLAGLETPDDGEIAVNGRTIFKSGKVDVPARDRRVGHIFQGYALFPSLSVFDNVAFGVASRSAGDRRSEVSRWLEAFGLASLSARYPDQISGGQAQRVALARAMATAPDFLLLDEPFAALDSHLKSRVELLVAGAVRSFPGVSVLVTHNLEEAFRIVDDLVVLDRGRVVAAGPKHEVFARPGNVAAAVLTGCKNVATGHFDGSTVHVPSWGCRVTLAGPAPAGSTHLGIRAHHIRLQAVAPASTNAFACRVASVVEAPFRMTVELLLADGGEPLQVEISKDAWRQLVPTEDSRGPLFAVLPPESLMPLGGGA